jgi:hypothetical protein
MPLVIAGATSGSTTVQATDAVTATITLPSATTTLVGATTPSFTTTIGVGGATPSASGAGITFPATQSGSTNANTLDDYEEGTWTPAYSPDGASFTSITYNTSFTKGAYTKVGRIVTVTGYLRTEAITKGAASGSMVVSGLPFAVGTSGETTTYRTQGNAIGNNFAGNAPIQINPNEGSTTGYLLRLNAIGSATSATSVVVADMATGANSNIIQFGLTYLAAGS